MILTLQWITLLSCTAVTVARIPSALRKENRSLFAIFALMALAVLLSIEAPYLAIDGALGGFNLANLALRLVIFGALMAVGYRIAKGFGTAWTHRLIIGPPGWVALGVCVAAVSVLFVLLDTSVSAVGMHQEPGTAAHQQVLLEYYGAVGRLYPAYVVAVLLPSMFRTALGNFPVLIRIAALLLSLGSVAIILTLGFPFIPVAFSALMYILNYTAILCFVAGLAMIWMTKLIGKRRPQRSTPTVTKS